MAKKILLADDSITIQKVVELTFSEGDYEVHCVGNGAQAIRKAEEVVPDIALVDVMMPQRNGYEVCSHIKQDPALAWIPVLLLTGTFEPFDPRRAEQAGANGHTTKPFESRALVAQVEDLLTSHPRPRAAAPERTAILPSPPPVHSEVVNAGQIFSANPAPPPGIEEPAAISSPATVRIDSRTFFSQLAAGERAGGAVFETPPPAETPSLGPLDLVGNEVETEPTHPMKPVPTSAGSSTARAAAATTPGPSTSPASAPSDEVMRALHEKIEALARPVLLEAAERILREVAWEVLPDVAERLVRQRIQDLEREAGGTSSAPGVH